MKNLPLKLAVLVLSVLFLTVLGSLFSPKKPAQPISVIAPPIIDVWLKPVSTNRYGLMVKPPSSDEFDTIQLVFKTPKTVLKFAPSVESKFILRVNLVKNEETILLLSTDGKLAPLPKQLGELSLSEKAQISALTIDPVRSKVIKAGKEFPINFLGVKR